MPPLASPDAAPGLLVPRRVRTRDGLDLLMETAGQGPPMLLCNGLYCSTHYYAPWIRHFSSAWQVAQFDYRGHGHSPDPPTPGAVTLPDLVNDAEDVLRASTEQPAVLVGHSMGVRVALELYDRLPHRFRCLILLCGSVFDSLGRIPSLRPFRSTVYSVLGLGTRMSGLAAHIKDFVVRKDLVSKVGYSLGGLSRELTPREPVELLLKNVSRLDIRLMSSLGRSYIAHTARPILPRVTVPTLVLVGANDTLAPPSHARAVARALRTAEVHVCEGCTHLAPVERPDDVHRVVDSFLHRHLR